MKPVAFDYVAATTVEEAVNALREPGAKVLAGGQSLVPLMNFRLSRPSRLVDINGVASMAHIEVRERELILGALVRHQQLVEDPEIRRSLPVLSRAAQHIGHWAIRTRGTLGGSVAHADPAAELPALLVALGATIAVVGPEGTRELTAEAFFEGFYTTALAPSELVTQVKLPLPQGAVGFKEVVRRPGDFALAGAYVERLGSGGAVTWFGFGDRPRRFSVREWPSDPEDRRHVWVELVRNVPVEERDQYKYELAVAVAEESYRDAGGEE
ncbi:MAG: FAD binding domain-containing protein [Firmicutes bacterium]|nr:FAD binding domain-containing protein [Bacillota bacterium]